MLEIIIFLVSNVSNDVSNEYLMPYKPWVGIPPPHPTQN